MQVKSEQKYIFLYLAHSVRFYTIIQQQQFPCLYNIHIQDKPDGAFSTDGTVGIQLNQELLASN